MTMAIDPVAAVPAAPSRALSALSALHARLPPPVR